MLPSSIRFRSRISSIIRNRTAPLLRWPRISSRITTWWALAIPNVSKAKWFRRNSFLFSMLSQSLAGHLFPKRDKLGAAPVSVIGDELWKRKFDSSPSVLGTVLI